MTEPTKRRRGRRGRRRRPRSGEGEAGQSQSQGQGQGQGEKPSSDGKGPAKRDSQKSGETKSAGARGQGKRAEGDSNPSDGKPPRRPRGRRRSKRRAAGEGREGKPKQEGQETRQAKRPGQPRRRRRPGESTRSRKEPAPRQTYEPSGPDLGFNQLGLRKPAPAPPKPKRLPKPERPQLLSLEEISKRLETVLEASAADETELVWLEVARGTASRQGNRIEVAMSPERTVLVRVLDLGRVGSYRTGAGEVGDLNNAVRLAMSQARVREPLSGLPHLPGENGELAADLDLHDEAIANLGPDEATALLRDLEIDDKEKVLLAWAHAKVVVFSSRKLRRKTEATGISFEVHCGTQPGAGRAAHAARRLDRLDPQGVIERARQRHIEGDLDTLPEGGVPVVLAPEAAISLVEMLNQESFSAKAYYDGTSFLREHLGIQVFDRTLNLVDDGTDPTGIAFPFDLEGTAKQRVPLILDGAPKTPTLDQRQAAVLGLRPTAHAIGGNDARAQNLFLVAGEASEEELLQGADGGLWIGWLDHLECREPQRVQFSARARGVRRIVDGKLGPRLPDLVWEDSLLRAFSALSGIGSVAASRLTRDGYLGGFSSPAIGISSVEGLRAR